MPKTEKVIFDFKKGNENQDVSLMFEVYLIQDVRIQRRNESFIVNRYWLSKNKKIIDVSLTKR